MVWELVAVAHDLVERHPDIKPIVLECSYLPPFAQAVQSAVARPVFDFITIIRYVHNALNQRPFQGAM